MIRFLLVCMLAASMHAAPSLMPLPAQMDLNSGALTIDGTFGATATGVRDTRLDAAMRRLSDRLSRQTGIPFLGPAAATLKIDCAARGADYPTLGEDESYTLDVTPEG